MRTAIALPNAKSIPRGVHLDPAANARMPSFRRIKEIPKTSNHTPSTPMRALTEQTEKSFRFGYAKFFVFLTLHRRIPDFSGVFVHLSHGLPIAYSLFDWGQFRIRREP